MIRKNKKLLDDFTNFCKKHPYLRFWQALSVWVGKSIIVNDKDTFYWESKYGQ